MVISGNGNIYSAMQLCYLIMSVMTAIIMITGISVTKGTKQASAFRNGTQFFSVEPEWNRPLHSFRL
jgi:hypothetical protein